MITDDTLHEPHRESSDPSGPIPSAGPIRHISSPNMEAITAPSAGVSAYGRLEGATGAAVLFRPDRYKASELGEVRVDLSVTDGEGISHRCQLYDMSQTGLAFLAGQGFEVRPEELLHPVTLRLEGYAAYEGRMQVRSVRVVDGFTVVGAVFLDDLLDTEEVLKLRDLKVAHESSTAAIHSSTSSWSVPGHHELKALIAEFSLFLRSAKDELNRLEHSVPWEDIHSDDDSPTRQQLIAMLDKGFVASFVDWTVRIDKAYRAAEPEAADRLKLFSRALLQSYMLEAPVLARTFHKPLGYAGDYVAMTYIYTRRFEGQSLFAKAVHRAATSVHASEAVRGRKDLLRTRLRRQIETSRGLGRPLRIASIAAGPAQETLELVQMHEPTDPEVHFVLFDQDKRALSYAHSNLVSVIRRKQIKNVKVTCIHDAIKSLLRGETTLGDYGPFDAIFSAGLMDYLRHELGCRLVRWYYDHLVPGGFCYVGNFGTSNPTRWTQEHICEWYLEYRTEAEMAALASRVPAEATTTVISERTGVNLFLILRKP